MKFDRYPISDTLKENLDRLGFVKTTDIQYRSIPSIMAGEDVFAIAQTGTGKTAAFAIPIIEQIDRFKSSKRSYGIKCVVMVPTHELARQIAEVFRKLALHTTVSVYAVYGGVDQDPQIQKLEDGIDVMIATPGRIFDLMHQGYIQLKRVSTLVLDEADQMLALGFIKDIEDIKKRLPQKHQTLFFSATINKEIKKLAYKQVRSTAIRIQISPENMVTKNVSHYVMFIEMDDKRFFLERFISDNENARIIVFVRTRVRAERVSKAMARVNIDSLTIHGEKEQLERAQVMSDFKSGACNILIATDISARGIDIADINYVINYDLPEEAEYYVHRIGRTGRGDKKGAAVSFCSTEEKEKLEEIQGFLEQEIEVVKVGKVDYQFTLDHPSNAKTLDTLRDEIDDWEKNAPKKKKKKAKKKSGKK